MEVTYYEAWLLSLAALFLGLFALVKGGDKIIDASVYVAKQYGVSPLVIGFTILAFGTSFPELVVSIIANLHGSAGIALGNVVGSNIANILCVMAITALVVEVRVKMGPSMARDAALMVAVTLLLFVLMYYTGVTRVAGASMVGILAFYVFYQYRASKKAEARGELAEEEDDGEEPSFASPKAAFLVLALGFVFIGFGAELLVKGATMTAGLMGIPEAIIALSVIALGTSLPELSTSIIAARKGHGEMVVGNIIGSNVFNVLAIIGIASLVKPMVTSDFPVQLATFDVWVALAAAVALIGTIVFFSGVGRVTAGFFLATYFAYNAYIYFASLGFV